MGDSVSRRFGFGCLGIFMGEGDLDDGIRICLLSRSISICVGFRVGSVESAFGAESVFRREVC